MQQERYPPDDPREWVRIARQDARLANLGISEPPLELLCFHAQQAVEKALKAVLLHQEIPFPRTHNIRALLDLLTEAGVSVPAEVLEAQELTQYAAESRYPLAGPAVTSDEHARAVTQMEAVLLWAAEQIEAGEQPGPTGQDAPDQTDPNPGRPRPLP
jgi:HEPN domain-containing protein